MFARAPGQGQCNKVKRIILSHAKIYRSRHIITSKKSPGVISGVQHVPNGEIVYNKELPATCRLSM